MEPRALGKALGRGPAPRWAPVAALLSWMFGAGVAAEPGIEARPLPAFHEIEQIAVKKRQFFDYLEPVVRAENNLIRRQRRRLLEIGRAHQAGEPMSWMEARYLEALAREYRVEWRSLSRGGLLRELLLRVDVIPRSLVLVQAAKESGWGSSRFARRGNNLFGQWCFESGCGLVPRERPAGMTHEIESFASVRDSVASYMRNLNTHRSYRTMRALRAKLRQQARPLSGLELAEGLIAYSQRGARYVREVQAMIRQNDLEEHESPMAMAGS